MHIAAIECGNEEEGLGYDGYGFDTENVAAIGYGGNQGYYNQGPSNQPYRAPFNPNQGNFNQGYNQHQGGSSQGRGGYGNQSASSNNNQRGPPKPPGFNQGPRHNTQNLAPQNAPYIPPLTPIPTPYPPPQTPTPPSSQFDQILTFLTNQNTQIQNLSQQNQSMLTQLHAMQTHQKMVDTQLAQLANPPPPPIFPGNPQPNPSAQHNSNPNQHTAKAIHLRSDTSYEVSKIPIDDSLGGGALEKGESDEEKENEGSEDKNEEEVVVEQNVSEKSVKEKVSDEEKKKMREKGKQMRSEGEKGLSSEIERMFTPPMPYPYRHVEKQIDDKFRRFLDIMSKMEMKIPSRQWLKCPSMLSFSRSY